MRKVFLDDLPRHGKGFCKDKINWEIVRELKPIVHFTYDDVEGELQIIDYNSKTKYLIIKYDNNYYETHSINLIKGYMAKILGIRTDKFKYKIGQTFKDDKRDITIIDRKREKDSNGCWYKYYKYKCNNPDCGFECGKHYSVKDREYKKEYLITEGGLTRGRGCSCCDNKAIVEGINNIPSIAPWMVKYFQGGVQEAKKYSPQSNQKIYAICPDCGRVKPTEMTICHIYKRLSIGCYCADGKPCGEKYLFNVLEQLNLDFKNEYSPKWAGKKRYDFYIPLFEHIIETHGLQHYKDKTEFHTSLREQQENDRIKKQLALHNGIREENYIVIDCRYSEFEFIKNNILHSRLNELFDLSKINWTKAEEFALSNLTKVTCELKKNNPEMTTTEIGNVMKLSEGTVRKYLKQGNNLGWNKYDPNEERVNGLYRTEKNKKKLFCFEINQLFKGVNDCARELEKEFGIKISSSSISLTCLGQRKSAKGFHFKYISDLTPEERIKYNIKDEEN